MKLPLPGANWNRPQELERNRQIEAADQVNLKSNRDNQIGDGRLILVDETTGARTQLYIAGGTVSTRTL